MRYPQFFFYFIFLCIGLLMVSLENARAETWQTASREPVGLAPDPAQTPEALIQVYGARAYSWRGYFGIHTWIAVKPSNAIAYTVYEVIGWRQRSNRRVLVKHNGAPDRRWYGNIPEVLTEKRGKGVDALIERIEKVVLDYPYQREYAMWPGPNSNTFTAWVSRAIAELELDLPPTAIGKDYLGHSVIALAPSGRGVQLSIYGLLGVLASQVEGVEINLLGLSFGVDPDPFAIKLPMVGRINLTATE